MNRKSYVGVGAVTNSKDANSLVREVAPTASHLVQIGVMVDGKTLRGEPSAFPSQLPVSVSVADIFPSNSKALNTIIYSFRDPELRAKKLAAELGLVQKIGGNRLHAVQLNTVWPPFEGVIEFKERHQLMQIILQLNQVALDSAGGSPLVVAKWLKKYKGAVDYVLFDPHEGHGHSLDAKEARKYLAALKDLEVSLGVAAGFGPDPRTFDTAELLLEEFPGLSFFTQDSVCDGTGLLSLSKATGYLKNAFALLEGSVS